MSNSLEERVKEAIAILSVPTEQDIRLKRQIDACNAWLETPDGKEMLSKITPYFGSILEYISKPQE